MVQGLLSPTTLIALTLLVTGVNDECSGSRTAVEELRERPRLSVQLRLG